MNVPISHISARTLRFAVAAGLTLFVASPASGQELEEACEAIAGSSIGAWTEHVVASPNGNFDMRFSLVDSRGGTWYEIRTQTAAGMSILQLKVPGFPFAPAEISEVVTKSGATPALRLPDSVVRQYTASARAGPLNDIRGQCRTAQVVGREDVTVPAGTFTATHLRFPASGGDVWVSGEVPFGIVRGDIPGQGSTELKAHGQGATSSIQETPMSLETGGASTDPGQ